MILPPSHVRTAVKRGMYGLDELSRVADLVSNPCSTHSSCGAQPLLSLLRMCASGGRTIAGSQVTNNTAMMARRGDGCRARGCDS